MGIALLVAFAAWLVHLLALLVMYCVALAIRHTAQEVQKPAFWVWMVICSAVISYLLVQGLLW